MTIAKINDQLLRISHHKVHLDGHELLLVPVDFAFAWLVNLRRLLHTGQLDVLLNLGALYGFHIEQEAAKVAHHGHWVQHNVFISDHVHGYFGLEPKVMEILPHRDLLLDELGPLLLELDKVVIGYRQVVGPRTHHIEQRCDAVQRTSDQEHTSLSSKLSLAVALRKVRLRTKHSLVYETLTGETHEHESLVELLCDVAV